MRGVSLNLRLGLTRRGGGAASTPAFTPTDLFAAAEAGFAFDTSDLGTLWQDTGGTVAITEDGQNAARMDDISGNGNNATQGTAGARPVYKLIGGVHSLLADGIDDFMALSPGLFTVSADVTFGFSMSLEAVGTAPYLLGTDPADNGFEFLTEGTKRLPRPAVITTGGNVVASAAVALVLGTKHTFWQTWDRSAGQLVLEKDGAEIVNTTGVAADIKTPATGYELFRSGSSARCMNVHLHRCFGISRFLTAQEKTDAKAWLDEGAGL